jgi:GNAT acetyltransferase 2
MLSDAPAHRLFVLLGPQGSSKADALPDILCGETERIFDYDYPIVIYFIHASRASRI